MIAPTSEVAWLRAEIARVEREAVADGLKLLAAAGAHADYPPTSPAIQAMTRDHVLTVLASAHGHAVALEADLIRRGVA